MHCLGSAPFGRVVPAMVTPMRRDGSVDFEATASLARHLVESGADGILVNGTTGESPVTHMDEKVEIVRAVKAAVDVPVISGAGSNDTAHTIRMVEQVQEAGADAVLVVAPYYSRPSQEGVYRHYRAVDESAEKPIIVYDVPGRTGLHITLDTYVRLAGLEHIAAVKDATGDLAGAIRKRGETGLTWYSGDDALYLPFLAIGAVGVISVVAHAAAGPMVRLAKAFDEGDMREARGIAVRLAPLVEAINGTGFQGVMAKAAVHELGWLEETFMRLPNVGPDESQFARVRKGMQASGVL
ncbi:dihydrodipicolinate synthase [Bifidobacterium bombi DSM 19703]|uniref:4-hydroxy-tetrahydrodipicolinate synthase n=2 Tax=Bifidobacterium bombi TaxID=471511 RepID=A0A080N4G6_9BIFI|nr:dihydrodipicolinate synthase [Bifidobacterium bombi DSM 19703]